MYLGIWYQQADIHTNTMHVHAPSAGGTDRFEIYIYMAPSIFRPDSSLLLMRVYTQHGTNFVPEYRTTGYLTAAR